MIPQIKFIISEPEEYLDILEYFIVDCPVWRDKIFSTYPELKKKVEGVERDESKEVLRRFFKNKHKKYLPVLEKVRKDFQESWDNINDEVMQALTEINEIEWDKDFLARVTLNPVCPRYIEKNAFDLYFGMADKTMKTIVLHELYHFMFFKKFKEIFPSTDEREFESPHLIWKLSEILPIIVLNDKRLTKIFEPQQEVLVYEDIQKLEINGRRVIDLFKDFYDKKKYFEDFIRKSYNFLKEHEEDVCF